MIKNCKNLIALLLICCIASCSSDLDFDQADDIVLSPRVDADLVFFTLGTETFIDASIPDTTIVVRDTTRLEFLDDSFVRDNIKEIELTFQVDNSFLQSFTNRSVFLNENGIPQYMLEFTVAPSTDGSVTRTTIIEELSENELEAIRNSIQLANEITLNTNGSFIDGTISLQSKAIYALEIEDL
jgi:hypothetical protein